MTESDSSREKPGGRAVLLVLVGLVLLLAAGWTAAYLAAGDKVPRGTTVAGVDIGGRSPDGAARALEAGLSERVAAPITVQVEGDAEQITPREAGLAVDYQASVADAGGEQSWSPARLWRYFTEGDELDPVVDVDEAKMSRLLERLADSAGTPPRDGDIRFEGGEVRVVEPRGGDELDEQQTRAELVEAFVAEEREPVELTLRDAQPEIGEADVQAALDEFANPALSGPVTLVFDDSPVTLTPRDFAPALGVRAEGGRLVPDLDEKVLTELVDDAIGDDGAPVDATVRIVDGKPRVVPAQPGVSYDPTQITDTFLSLVTRPEGKRRLAVKATVAEPEFTTADARQLGIKERVSSFTTYFPYAEYRNVNIGRAAELVTGTVLKPGETFSMNDIVGERTRENGFTEGTIISDGVFKDDLGGGVSQMATTLFNGMFFAGLKDVEHKPHSFYIDRYPVGREATVAWGAVDLKFQNDTEHGVLVDARVTPSTPSSQGVVTVSMYSTKTWDITTSTSDRYAFTPPQTRRLQGDDCVPNAGYSGFQVDVMRYFRKPGQDALVKQEKFHTVYTPSDTVICE